MTHEMYSKIDTPAGTHLEACPVCGSDAGVWQYQKEADGPAQKVICCTNEKPFGPQLSSLNEGCLLFMPPDEFYKATIREAAKYWNEYAKALEAFRRKKHWEAAQVTREAAKQEQPAQEQYPLPDSLYPGSKDWMAGSYKERVEWLHGMYESAKQEIARLEAQQAQEPVMYQYRWLNPGDNPDQPESELEWKLVEVRNVYTDTIANRIDELRGYRFSGKPVYEVRPLYAAPPTQPALSDDEILNCFYASKSEGMGSYMLAVGRAVEAHCRGGVK